MICPYCEQGSIIKARVKIINKNINICSECDTVWEKEEIISANTGISFDIYAELQNIKPLWSELEILNDNY